MSTTYYAVMDCCEHCGRAEMIEVGHTAVGWIPSIYTYPDLGLNSVADWDALDDARKVAYVENEYGDRESWPQFIERMREWLDMPRELTSHADRYGEGSRDATGLDLLEGARYGGRETVRSEPAGVQPRGEGE